MNPTNSTVRRAAALIFIVAASILLFLRPDALGNNGYRVNWIGDPTLGILNNYVEATVYVGLMAIPLVTVAKKLQPLEPNMQFVITN